MLEPFKVEAYLDDVLQSRIVIEKGEANVGAVLALFKYPEWLRDASEQGQLESDN